jgi:hypothetical protein
MNMAATAPITELTRSNDPLADADEASGLCPDLSKPSWPGLSRPSTSAEG